MALDVHIDPALLLFTTGVGVAAGLFFGIVPAWQILRMGKLEGLKEGGRSGTARLARQRLRATLVTAEVALALILLVGAGLFVRSLARLEEVSPGFNPSGVITASVSLPIAQYDGDAKQMRFYRAVLERLSAIGGVTAVAAGMPLPFSGNNGLASFQIEGRPSPPGDPDPHGDIGIVSPAYFSALRIPLRTGRVFGDQDRKDTEPVVLIDETLARQYWPGENPVGSHMRNGSHSSWATIVGVVGHVKHSDLAGEDVKGKYYFPMFQQGARSTTFLVRTQGASGVEARLGTAIRQAVQAIDPNQPVAQIRTMSGMVAESLAARRFVVLLLGFFAGMALLMAVLGLYGVIAYSVAQRTQEIGIRMALGARRADVLALVIGQGVRLAGGGALIGLAASFGISRALRSQLFQISPFDPVTFALMAMVLAGAALIASYIPARRAMRVDPMEALRYE